MKILGINISHHMSYCFIEDSKIKMFVNEERINKQKRFGPTIKTFNEVKGLNLFKNFSFDFVAITSWDGTEKELPKLILDKLDYKGYSFDRENHHKYHAIAGLYHSNLDEAMALVRDGGGAAHSSSYPSYRETDTIWKVNKNKIDFVYGHYSDARTRCRCNNVCLQKSTCLGKEFKDINNSLLSSKIVGGFKYANLSTKAGFGEEYGQFMGLAPYAEVKEKYDGIDYEAVKLAHEAQQETFVETCELIEKSELINAKNIILSGGYFLNCLNNFKLVKKYPNINFFVDPIPHDAGTSIGVAMYVANYI